MIKSIITYFFIFLSCGLLAQSVVRLDRETLPAYVISNNDTIGMVFSIENVQTIDKNLELLEYMEELNSKVDTTQYYYISLVESLEEKIQIMNYKIVNISSQSLKKDDIILKLKKDIHLSDVNNSKKDTIIDNKDRIIKEKDKEIKKQTTLKNVAIGGGILLVVLTLIFG